MLNLIAARRETADDLRCNDGAGAGGGQQLLFANNFNTDANTHTHAYTVA